MPALPHGPRPASRQLLADYVYQELLSSLMDGRLEPGSGLGIDRMAAEFAVSPTPIREALARLESTGLVHRVALKGYRVAPLFTPEELAELMDARLVIEPAIAERACAHATKDLLTALRVAVDDLRTAPTGPTFAEYGAYWEADERFHRLIAEQADNRFLLNGYRALGGQVQRFRFFGNLGVTDAECAIAEHTRVLEAFTAQNPAGAREAMRAHILRVRDRAVHDASATSAAS
ncbi:GntR family transcriptional regulator [Tersicoccus sp. Bi-70]|uniref:GntR family transcriptional regulator n=1 Tax=Tersicoccus sp. Bi-70 TaxID=1897634 RepID=UPI0009784B72|nr:GntR family transcriptional regulator [Tersicoccus sp. Bi-70]OMH36682.1 GntR family transcriptional regulator [Tersicoccus sp. Bi-70]